MCRNENHFHIKLINIRKGYCVTTHTYYSYFGNIQVGECEISMYKDSKGNKTYFAIFNIKNIQEYKCKGFAKMLIAELEKIAKGEEYKVIVGEWLQEEIGHDAPAKLAASCRFKQMTKEDYNRVSYPIGQSNRINYKIVGRIPTNLFVG